MDPYSRSRYEQGIDSKIVIMGNSGALSPWSTVVLVFLTEMPPTGVGKTSLLQRYTQNKFDPKNTTSTSGAFFVTKKVYVNGLKVRLQLWDTAGQERFRSMVCFLFLFSFVISEAHSDRVNDRRLCIIEVRSLCPVTFPLLIGDLGANAALLLYDITNASTFEDIRGWLEGKTDFHVLIERH